MIVHPQDHTSRWRAIQRSRDIPGALFTFFHGLQPSVVVPTVLAVPQARSRPGPLDDLDYCIGDEALAAATSCSLHYPVRQGVVGATSEKTWPSACEVREADHLRSEPGAQVESWDTMERFWQQCFFE